MTDLDRLSSDDLERVASRIAEMMASGEARGGMWCFGDVCVDARLAQPWIDAGVARLSYFQIGRDLLRTEIARLLRRAGDARHAPPWSYHHVNSTCVERDSRGDKIRNRRHLSTEALDADCVPHYLLVPIYNTAPGFPSWFRKLSKQELLAGSMLVSKLFRLALQERPHAT